MFFIPSLFVLSCFLIYFVYKALLFLGAGSVIHSVADNQDFRKYGGLISFLPLTYSVMLIASLSLVAFPFMTGFYSKDFILESAYGQFYFSGTVVYFIATIGAMFTTLYSVKVLYLTFLTNPNGPLSSYKGAHEGDLFLSIPLITLAVFSIFFGYITKDIFIGMGSGFFSDNGLFIHPTHELLLDTEFAVPTLFKLLPLMFTVSLSVIAITLSEFLPKVLIEFKSSRLGYNVFGFFNQRFLIEMFYNKYITNTVLKIGGQTTKFIDKGSVELIGPYGLEKGLLNLSSNIASLDTGVITSYALYILVGLIFYITIPYLSLFDNSLILIIIYGLLSIRHIKKQQLVTKYKLKSCSYNPPKGLSEKNRFINSIYKVTIRTYSTSIGKYFTSKLFTLIPNNNLKVFLIYWAIYFEYILYLKREFVFLGIYVIYYIIIFFLSSIYIEFINYLYTINLSIWWEGLDLSILNMDSSNPGGSNPSGGGYPGYSNPGNPSGGGPDPGQGSRGGGPDPGQGSGFQRDGVEYEKDLRDFDALNKAYENYMQQSHRGPNHEPRLKDIVHRDYCSPLEKVYISNFVYRKSGIIIHSPYVIGSQPFIISSSYPSELILNENTVLTLRHFVGVTSQ